jgi:early secretory antigenic target protein ESAT-6
VSGDDYTSANFSGLSTGAAAFAQTASALMTELEDLEGKLKAKLAQWEGNAQSAYHTYQQQWSQSARDMQQIVSQLGTAISDSHDNYQAAERANTQNWSG